MLLAETIFKQLAQKRRKMDKLAFKVIENRLIENLSFNRLEQNQINTVARSPQQTCYANNKNVLQTEKQQTNPDTTKYW